MRAHRTDRLRHIQKTPVEDALDFHASFVSGESAGEAQKLLDGRAGFGQIAVFTAVVEWRGAFAVPRSPRTGREPRDSCGSYHQSVGPGSNVRTDQRAPLLDSNESRDRRADS